MLRSFLWRKMKKSFDDVLLRTTAIPDAGMNTTNIITTTTRHLSSSSVGIDNNTKEYKKIKELPICVTGGSGFLGSWIVKGLLDRGYERVRTTTRKMEKAKFLQNLLVNDEKRSNDDNKQSLEIFDGCDFESGFSNFEDAIRGCHAVIHCASPFFNANGTRDNLIKPAVEGTELVLNLCSAQNVERVVLTSSTAAVVADYGSRVIGDKNHIYTDKDFSPSDILEEKKNYYCLSKLYAEQRAWELSKKSDCSYKLCVMNPGLILGPMIEGQTHLNTSSASILQYMDGTHSKIQNGYRTIVDVRDVADAHILPLEKDNCWDKRYILIGGAPHFSETASVIKDALTSNGSELARSLLKNVPTKVNKEFEPTVMGPPAHLPLLYDAQPAEQELGIQFKSVQEMITSCVNELLDNGFTDTSQQYDTNKL